MIFHFRDKQAEVQRRGVAGKVMTGVWIFQLPACSFPPNTSLCIFANPTAHLVREGGVVGERRGEAGLPFSSFLTTSSNLSSQPLGGMKKSGKGKIGKLEGCKPRPLEAGDTKSEGTEKVMKKRGEVG